MGTARLDIFLLQNGGPDSRSTNRLFHQEPDGTFKDVTDGSGLGTAGYAMGVAVGDVNNDGRPDILVTEYGRLRLFLNLGGGRFEDVAERAGLSSILWGASAAFLDYDRDGRLDIVVANYIDYTPGALCAGGRGTGTSARRTRSHTRPPSYSGTRARAAGGKLPAAPVTFRDETEPSGVGARVGPGLGVAVADFDGDGWPDIFVANDGRPNRLWINRRNGTFSEEALPRGVAMTGAGHGVRRHGGRRRGRGQPGPPRSLRHASDHRKEHPLAPEAARAVRAMSRPSGASSKTPAARDRLWDGLRRLR